MKNIRNFPYTCPVCGGKSEANMDEEFVMCPFCGENLSVSDLIKEDEHVQAEKVKANAYKDVEMEKLSFEREKLQHEAEKEKEQEEKEEVRTVFLCFCVFDKKIIIKEKVALFKTTFYGGVGSGIRTHGLQDHNLTR